MVVRALAVLISSLLAFGLYAEQQTEVHAVALFNGKTMLSVNNGRAKIIKQGETFQGVELVSATTKEAVVNINGQQETLTLNGVVSVSDKLRTSAPTGSGFMQLWEDERGFFKADGSIDGAGVEFLVDTGANLVVVSSAQADRLGLDYQDGDRGVATTASGRAPMYIFEATEVSLGQIKLDAIEVGVIQGNYPITPLLGMSFLERVDMNRTGNRMTLRKRY